MRLAHALSIAVALASVLAFACVRSYGVADENDDATPYDSGSTSLDGATTDANDDTDASTECHLPTEDTFNPLSPRWVLRGAAAVLPTGGVQLSQNAENSNGQVYWDEMLALDRFDVRFSFSIKGEGSTGDGMALAWLAGSTIPPPGPGAGGFSIRGNSGYAIIIDTFRNGGEPDVPSISLRKTANFEVIASSIVISKLLDGMDHVLVARLSGGNVEVELDDELVLTAPIPNYISLDGHIAFSAGTGNSYNEHTITSVTLRAGSAGPCASP